ncbi:MAG: hypothetical protein ACYSR9_10815 [Planctomycetota bacterium]|jgi:hypothetical protein
MDKNIFNRVFKILSNCQKIDIHTHLTSGRLMARGLDDILLYHMVNTELYSAGSAFGERVTEDRDEEEAERRLEEAVPYIPFIRNTPLYRTVRTILKDLYDWSDEITAENWRGLHTHIKNSNKDDKARACETLDKCKIVKTGTELARRADGRDDDIFDYALEWAFFARAQWGQPDIALFELERAWNAEEPENPVPVTMKKEDRPSFKKTITTPENIKEAVAHYCSLIPYNGLTATTQHISTDISYGRYSDDEFAQALKNRENAGNREQSIYTSAIMVEFLSELQKHSNEIVFQFSIGAEALPFESGARLKQDTISQLSDFIAEYPGLKFMCFNASRHCNQSLCTLVRELPNFSLAGFWWHSFFPGALREMIEERLDMVPVNRQCGYFSDAYCIDWIYGKNDLLLTQYAHVFAEKIEIGQYTIEDVEFIAKQIFFETPVEILSFSI